MNRGLYLWCAIALVAAGTIVLGAESLRIVPTVRDDRVLVSVQMADAYTEDLRSAIFSGLQMTFVYDVELRLMVPAWVDPTIATAVISISDRYDNLTRRHNLSRTVDGRFEQMVTEDEAVVRKWLTSLDQLLLCRTSKLEQNREYYVRINARMRPQRSSFFGWATGITGQAKFTFIP